MSRPKKIVLMHFGRSDKTVFELGKADDKSPRVFVNSQAVVFVDPNDVVKSDKFKTLVTDLAESVRQGLAKEVAREEPLDATFTQAPRAKP